ncbi:MAG: hypothetical protein HQK61_02555 [Desulfamplus sp.]|nr:hypothetical protein [Desulfamplus sp.]
MNIKKNFLIFLKVAIVILVGSFILVQKAQKPRILIMHSYHTDYPWVIQIDEGIRRIFEGHRDITLRHYYMDLKNHTSDDFKRTAASTAHLTIKNWKPDLLVISDDVGQALVGSKYLNDPAIKVVFCGVNGDASVYGYDKADNTTGILERKPLSAIRETLMMIAQARGFRPDDPGAKKPKVVFVCDESASVTAELPGLDTFDWQPLEWLEPVRADNFEQWKKAIKEVNEYADLVLVSDYREFRLPTGEKEPVSPSEIMAWTEANSKIPILGMSLINVSDGGMISVFTSGYEQGEVAGRMALDIVRGEDPRNIEITRTKQFLIAVRKSAMENRKLPIPDIYEAFARATENFYE